MSKCRYNLTKDCHDKDCFDCVLEDIRKEFHENAEKHEDGDYYLRDEWVDEIIDNRKVSRRR